MGLCDNDVLTNWHIEYGSNNGSGASVSDYIHTDFLSSAHVICTLHHRREVIAETRDQQWHLQCE